MEGGHERHPSRNQETSSAKSTDTVVGPAMTTKSPAGNSACLTAWRIRRLARFRCTAFPVRFPATNPTRTWAGCPGALTTIRSPTRRRVPSVKTRRKSSEDLRGRISGRDAFAAFDPPGLEYGPSGTSRHTVPEAMLALAAPNLWLKCAFHGEGALKNG